MPEMNGDLKSQYYIYSEEYADLVEPLSLDEAYLDVIENKFDMEFAMDIATEIKQKIK